MTPNKSLGNNALKLFIKYSYEKQTIGIAKA